MLHLKRLLFGIILLSSFGSAFAEEYDPNKDVFDQIINVLVPTLIVFLFDTKGKSEKKEKLEDSNSEELEKKQISVFIKIRQEISPVKIRRAFDDFLFLLSLFVLPCIVFYKNHKEFAIPIWIPMLFGAMTGFVFFVLIDYYIISYSDSVIIDRRFVLGLLGLFIDLGHIISDICFIFYTKSIPESNFTNVFIYSHAVTGILGSVLLLYYICEVCFIYSRTYEGVSAFEKSEPFLRKLTITATCLWTPIVQMLNMSLLSGNDYYWTKSILALNMIYLSRVINYAEKNVKISKYEKVPFACYGSYAINKGVYKNADLGRWCQQKRVYNQKYQLGLQKEANYLESLWATLLTCLHKKRQSNKDPTEGRACKNKRQIQKAYMFTELRSTEGADCGACTQNMRTNNVHSVAERSGALGGPSTSKTEHSEPPELEAELESESEGDSDYETASAYQNTNTRWYSAIRRFYFGERKETHIRYNGEANAISWRSEGQIDLRKTGTYAMASLRFFQDVSRAPKKAEDLSPEEDHWIKSAYMGGLVWAEPYEGIATELDYNEYYPHILAYEGACWPIGYYTHYDIQMAIDLGLYIELSSESPNALIFEQNKLMSGHDIFHQWARYLTEIKHEGGQKTNIAKNSPNRHFRDQVHKGIKQRYEASCM
ncbi:hypothetical protein RhiirA1_522824 [Rhizophagus irregularis]|uniref:DNA-directed DNA polymerase n=1 Tax=Rhizophagus irregularis TaxID=588596 RepID=A0A2N0RFQ0_9GLOM|nr:hypothetical protein RhiirA1_522824 [Rhizophagus irregularis]